ncbi:MAG: NACHT domain-containing protein, partial [Cyanobacteria bacterium J06642_11]
TGVVLSLIGTLGCMLPLIVICGLRGPEMGNKTMPNQGVWKSAHNAGIFTLIFGLVGGLTGWLLDIWLDNLLGSLNHSVTGTLMGGLAGGMMGGASACLRHFSLRFRLYQMGHIPWNYARFLDYAAERLFLQKVGGGYIFIHRMLLEHFAQMTLEQKRPQ